MKRKATEPLNPIERTITLRIAAGPTHCNYCEFKQRVSTGLAGEWHAHCIIFNVSGRWREHDMKRPAVCLAAGRQERK